MTTGELGYTHRFEPVQADGATTLLLLHGTGADENSLLPLGRRLLPTANMLSPRGKVLENGMARFFRRLALGVFDVEDLIARTHELATFVNDASTTYGFNPEKVVAVGFSNGANIAASMLLLHPTLLAAAVLFKAQVPLEPQDQQAIPGTPVFVAAGRTDELIAPTDTERLIELLRDAGADVTVRWQPGGHQLTLDEVEAAREWLAHGPLASD